MIEKDELCKRCGGDGVDPDQSGLPWQAYMDASPRACDWCNGDGKQYQEPDWT